MSLKQICCALLCLPLLANVNAAADDVKNTGLTATTLLSSFLGEVALQRHLYPDALEAFLVAARESRDITYARRAIKLAKSLNNEAKLKDALKTLETIDPNDVALRFLRSEDLLKDGRFDAISSDLIDDLRKLTTLPEYFRDISILTQRLKDKTARLRFLTRFEAEESIQKSPQALMILAYAAKEAKLPKAAADYALKSASLMPENGQLLLEAEDFAFLTDPESTLKRLKDFLSRHPEDVSVLLGLARAQLKQTQKSQALDSVKEALRIFEKNGQKNPHTLYYAGTIVEEASEYEQARRHYERYISLIKGDKRYIPDVAYVRLGVIAMNEKKWSQALDWFSKVEKGDKYIPARVKQAEILSALGKTDEACRVFRSIRTKGNAQRSLMIQGCAQVYLSARRMKEAQKTFFEAEKLTPEDPALIYRIASLAEHVKDDKTAENYFRRYIKLRPNEAQGYNSLGYLWLDRGVKTKEAGKMIDKAMELSQGKSAYIVDSLGWLRYREGNLVEAERLIKKSLSMQYDPEVVMHLAQILELRGKTAEAKTALAELLKKNPTFKPAQEFMKRLEAHP